MKLKASNMGPCGMMMGVNLTDDEDEEEEGKRWSSGATIAVAVDKDKNSIYALRWALDHLISKEEAQTLVLIHVRSPILTIPTPMGNHVPIAHVCEDAAALYIKQVELQTNELLQPYLHICNSKKVQADIRVLENENIPKAIVEHISNFNIRKMVIGSSSRNVITRKFMAPDVPTGVAKLAPKFCTVYVVSKGKLSSLRSADFSTQIMGIRENITSDHNLEDPSVRNCIFAQNGSEPKEKTESETLNLTVLHSRSSYHEGHRDVSIQNQVMIHSNTNEDENANEDISSLQSSNIDIISSVITNSYAETESEQTYFTNRRGISDFNKGFFPPTKHRLQSVTQTEYRHYEGLNGENTCFAPTSEASIMNWDDANSQNENTSMGIIMTRQDSDKPSTTWDLHAGSSSLRSMSLEFELEQTGDIYNLAFEEANNSKHKLSPQAKDIHFQETNKLEVAKAREEVASAIVSEEKVTYAEGMEEAEATRVLAEIETKQRTLEYYIPIRKSNERGSVEHTLATGPQTYKKYSMEEIESATDFFSESLKIGEGSYGSVYKCTLDNTLVAIKVLCPDASQGWKQFQKEVEVLSHIRHPHMVLLLGACPEFGCLVYEYMENGSLEDRLFRRGATPSLPWHVRFRIASEVATGLLYLHSAKPKPLVHRDLKPANILLDHNFVSKIGDVGLAKLVSYDLSGSTDFRNTTTSGTFCYIDPEYQQTGILGTKSDLYALGVVLLQLLTAKKAMGLAYDVEKAINKGSFKQILDQTVRDWPVKEALELAKLALKCVELRRRDRPDLETVVLPELQKLKAFSDSNNGRRKSNSFISSPSKILRPNLQVSAEDNTEEVITLNISSTGSLTKNTFPKKLKHFYRKVF
ncbi:U-box domain-containing protein 35 isoform X2 [Cryptomeria japonica]|uniref:U-box domain-containing protein 35 isoform X2 n=1 Tax=Cryptomeria japonica TaxID=3369 RepID=UPI0025AD6886|nr:U-box domain-containing protein 35 isoform X2 [Cryptomeria japonica]